ncbi:cysteine desulfurase [Paenibacillus sp. P96]|uniref:Cysteine desulfurase n=1 Tax=Paenibacillus zeirhizosphaerae TaxID=2987519 RepID=A0ABT9FQF5_9BACL|nr:cysteine desulfurase family protein [Paenibacillus sp. P96]MDP4096963.1 cysteine desulfurase [Paenibacillus sp. P96]
MLYFDHAATTPPYEEVVETVAELMRRHYGNPSSLHKYGEEAGKLLKRAREVCAAALDAKPGEIIFTSGATESNNLAVKGAVLQYASRGRHLVTAATEHPSVFESCRQLEQMGYELTVLPVDEQGHVSADQVAGAIRKDTVLVSIMHVNNETGRMQPIHEIGPRLKAEYPKVLFHVDGVQSFGKLPVKLKDWGIDLFSLSGHKIRGPKGTGLLYVREGIKLLPLLTGGGQEFDLRAGTENVPLIVGLAKAVRMAEEGHKQFAASTAEWRDMILEEVRQIPSLVLNSGAEAPHIVNFSHPGMKAEVMLHTLEQLGAAVSTKSACSSRLAEPSRVLIAMGRSGSAASGGIRISFGDSHSAEEVKQLALAIQEMMKRLKSVERWGR